MAECVVRAQRWCVGGCVVRPELTIALCCVLQACTVLRERRVFVLALADIKAGRHLAALCDATCDH